MTNERLKQISFCLIQLLRKEIRDNWEGTDQKDVDDYIFSELDLEVNELAEIVQGYDSTVYTGSCFCPNESPKNYDKRYFEGI